MKKISNIVNRLTNLSKKYILPIIVFILGLLLTFLVEGCIEKLAVTISSLIGTISLSFTIKLYAIKIEDINISMNDKIETIKTQNVYIDNLSTSVRTITNELHIQKVQNLTIHKSENLDSLTMARLLNIFKPIEDSYSIGQTIYIGFHYQLFIDFEIFVDNINSSDYIFVNNELNLLLDELKEYALEFEKLYDENIENLPNDTYFMRFKYYRLDREQYSKNSTITKEEVSQAFEDRDKAENLLRLMVQKKNEIFKKYREIVNDIND